MKKSFLICGTLFCTWLAGSLSAQQNTATPAVAPYNQIPCGTPAPGAAWDQWFNQQVATFKQQQGQNRTLGNFTIPVIIHVIENGEAVGTFPNLSAAQLTSQIQVLNDDYSGHGYNTGNTPAIFTSLISNTGIQFCLALKDTLGNALSEPGIDRVNCSTRGITNPTTIANSSDNSTFTNYLDQTLKPATIWNPVKYMNIWVSDRPSGSGLLGYTTFPAGSGLTGITTGTGTVKDDGVWVYGQSFGTTGTLVTGYQNGRVCSHETGHYVGLRHTWGDGTCADDYCADTPPTQQANYGCPTFPHNKGVCTGDTTGEMTMNLMDYTDDLCKYMMTPDQTLRIQTAMTVAPFRKLLGTHGLCTATPAPPVANLSVNQTTVCAGSPVIFSDLSSNTPTSWKWTFTGGNPPASSVQNPTVTYSTPGSYAVKLVVANASGKDSVTKTSYITVNAAPAAPVVTSNKRCGTGSVTLSASGTSGDSLQWFDAAAGGNLVHTGPTYTPVLTTSQTFYVSQTPPPAANQTVGPVDSTLNAGGGFFNTNTLHGLVFNVLSPCVLKTVKVYASTAGRRTIQLLDTVGGTVLQSVTSTLPVGMSTVTLNFNLATGNHYFLKNDSLPQNLYRNTGGATYPYTLNGVLSITGNDIMSTFPGYYYYFYDWQVAAYSCSSPRVPVSATINTNPAIPTITLGGNTLTSTAATTYQWYLNGVLIPGATAQNYVPSQNGNYTVVIGDVNGCQATSALYNMTNTGMGSISAASFSAAILPNPNQGFFTLQFNAPERSAYTIEVCNLLGQVVYREQLENFSGAWSKGINLSEQNKGVYLLSIRNTSQNGVVRKIVIY